MITAIIDLGTNTFNLLIVEIKGQRSKKLYKTKIPVKLGEGGINNNFITKAAFQRGLNSLKVYRKKIDEFGAQKIIAFATSAIRSASNGNEFVLKAKQITGIEIVVIDGEREAELIYKGVMTGVTMTDESSLIIDIGGGSTEFIIANRNEVFWKKSFLLGASRLLEKFTPSDPITTGEIIQIKKHLEHELKSLFEAVQTHPIKELIGSSGSFDSLAEMIAYKFYTPEILKNKTEYLFNLEDCKAIHRQIIGSTTKERKKIKGLVKMRVDMIVIASIIVDFIIERFRIKNMKLSTYSLKEGVLSEVKNKKL